MLLRARSYTTSNSPVSNSPPISPFCSARIGYTDPTSLELKRMMADHGGVYRAYYSASRVTHTIATNLPDAKAWL